MCKILSHCFMAVRPFKCKMMDLSLKLDKERNEVCTTLFQFPSIINHGSHKRLMAFLVGWRWAKTNSFVTFSRLTKGSLVLSIMQGKKVIKDTIIVRMYYKYITRKVVRWDIVSWFCIIIAMLRVSFWWLRNHYCDIEKKRPWKPYNHKVAEQRPITWYVIL